MHFSSQSPSLAEIITCPCFFILPLDVLTDSYHGLCLPFQAEDKLILPILTNFPFPKRPSSTSQLSPWEATLFHSPLPSAMQSVVPKWHHIGMVMKKKKKSYTFFPSKEQSVIQLCHSWVEMWISDPSLLCVLLHFTGLDSAGKLPISCDQRQGICFSPELIALLCSQDGSPSLQHPQTSAVTMMRAFRETTVACSPSPLQSSQISWRPAMVSPRQKEKRGSNIRGHVTIPFNGLVQLCPQIESHKLLESLFFCK